MIKSQFFFINNSLLEIIYSLFKIPKKSESIKKLKKLVSSKNIILTNFGRTAFYFILKFLKKKKPLKKEVLVCSYNFFEVINMIIYNNLKPVFYDLDKYSLNLSVKDLKKKINKNTLCIVVTHFNGFNQNILKIREIAKKKNIEIIEDCAISLNSKNKVLVSKIGSFSFYSLNFTKNLSSITGGIIKTNNSNFKALKDIIFRTNFSVFHNIKNFLALFLIKLISYKYIYNTFNFLLTSNEKPIRKIFDLNYKLQTKKKIPNYYLNNLSYNNYNILNYSIKKLPKENIIRIANNLKYFRLLKRKKTITNLIPKRNLNLVTLEYPILFKSKKIKNLFITELKKNKLDIRKKYYTNCSEINIFKKFKKNKTPNSEKVEKNIICLPNHPAISKDMIKEYSRLIK